MVTVVVPVVVPVKSRLHVVNRHKIATIFLGVFLRRKGPRPAGPGAYRLVELPGSFFWIGRDKWRILGGFLEAYSSVALISRQLFKLPTLSRHMSVGFCRTHEG